MPEGNRKRKTFYPAGKLPGADLSRLIARYCQAEPRVVVGPGTGRDAAVIDFGPRYLVAKTDPITFATEEIGWYAVQVNANDVAAMGAIPRWFQASLLLPAGKTGPAEVDLLFRQMAEACREIGAVLCGGHTEITPALDRPIVVGQMLGEVEKENLIRPDRARPGDEILLTKGIAIEGTALLARELSGLKGRLRPRDLRRCRGFLHRPGISIVPEARIACRVARVHALHDPTEGGLVTGLRELAEAAGLGLTVEREKIPVFPETHLLCRELGLDPLGLIASGALIIVAPPGESARIAAALKKDGIPVAVIGRMWEKKKGMKLAQGGRVEEMPVFPRDEVVRAFERNL